MKIKSCKIACFTACLALISLSLAACNQAQNNTPPNADNIGRNMGLESPAPTTNLDNAGKNMSNEIGRNLKNDMTGIMDGNNPAGNQTQITPTTPTAGPQGNSNTEQRSMNIKNQLQGMNEIENVNTLVSGNTCIVSYSPSKNMKDKNATKQMVIDKVKQVDPTITNVIVSESMDVGNDISRIMNDIASGKPVNEVNQEILKLFNKVTPSMS